VSDAGQWSRRGIFSTRGLAASTGGMLAPLIRDSRVLNAAAKADDRSVAYCSASRRAMACDFIIHFNPLVRDPLLVGNGAFDEVDRIEELLSIYRADSQISRVNREAHARPVRVDAMVFNLLKRAAELTEQTQGAFDIATGSIIEAWGFHDKNKRVPSADQLAAAMATSGMQHVELDEKELTVRFRTPGVKINLGAIGKGFAIDRAVHVMRRDFGITCALMAGGSSSLRGLGSLDGESGWVIGIEDPDDPCRNVATVRLLNRAMGTSNPSNQFFEAGGRRFGHLLDPRTGWPANEVASVSVLAPDGATADALATAFFVMGLDKTAEFCHNHPKIAVVMVLKPSDVKQTSERSAKRVVTFNLSPLDVRRC